MGQALLDRLDRISRLQAELAEQVAELRAEVAALEHMNSDICTNLAASEGNCRSRVKVCAPDDFAPEHLIDTTSAAARFGYSREHIARWAREGCGIKQGGRWLVSVPRLQRRLNGK